MTGATLPNIPPSDSALHTDSSPPPWHLIHFDVLCARCGHDLRGQSDPVCPACRLEFEWSDAAPLEELTCGQCNYHLYGLTDSRCPECGTSVDWNEALLRYRTSQKPLFEYRWRDNFLRSLVKTWKVSLRPRLFWKEISIQDPPRPAPLALFVFFQLIATLLTIVAYKTIFSLGLTRSIVRGTGFGKTPSILDLPSIVGNQFSDPHTYLMLGLIALWFIFTVLSLLVFQISMRLCQVRFAHVFRVCAYSALTFVPIYVLGFVILGEVIEFLRRSGLLSRGLVADIIGFGFLLAILILPTYSILNGYRHYIRMPHSPGVAICSQIMAILAMAITITLMSVCRLI